MRTIAVLHALEPHQLATIRQAAPEFEVLTGTGEELADQLKEVEIVAGWSRKVKELCLQPETALRWVQVWGAGVERMPLAEFAERGVMLTNASGVHANQISETVLGMMLAFARKLHVATRNQTNRRWEWVGELEEIHGKTIGIVGVGAIGEEIARLAQAFRMRVLGVRKSGRPSPGVDKMYGNDGLDEVLRESDYVVITLPLTDETRGLFGRERLSLMKSTAVLINIGRGRTIDEAALIDALRDGTIAGAGLDVFEQEPLPESSPLWELENVIVTPHNSGSSVYYNDRAVAIFADNLRHYVSSGAPARNRVNLEEQY